MSAAYDKLKELLEKQGSLTNEEVDKVQAELGAMTDDEKLTLEADRHKKTRTSGKQITMEEYLAASKILDSAPEGSDEYQKAEAIVNAYESGG
ncbi:MAG: hypothetical protein HXY40_03505 [Chloroflexi bacterium]|nr:hypothetical protein [Chloroflexota bacterium]